MRIFLSLLVLVMVSGCSDAPSIFPTGSYRAQEAYKTTSGPAPNNIGYEYSVAENEKVIRMWEDVMVSLVDQLESDGLSPQRVYIMPSTKENAFFLTFDHVLREELRARGYDVSTDVRGALVVDYDADYLRDAKGERTDRPEEFRGAEPPYAKRALRVSAWSGGRMVATANAVHLVPTYGFEDQLPTAKQHSVTPPNSAEDK